MDFQQTCAFEWKLLEKKPLDMDQGWVRVNMVATTIKDDTTKKNLFQETTDDQ